jgi:biopolymer transport protein ExbD
MARKAMRLPVAVLATLTATALAGVALVVPRADHPSVGLPVRIAKTRPCGNDDYRAYVVQVLRAGVIKLNSEDVHLQDLGRRLDEDFKTRVYHYIFLTAEPELRFGEVAQVIDHAAPHVDHVVIIPPSVMRQVQPWWKTGICVDENLPSDYLSHPPR